MAAFLAAGPAARPGAGGDVDSTGVAAPNQPSNLGEPGDDFVNDDRAHDPDEGATFDGTEHYDLRQGPHPEDKEKWAATDYIHWKVHGATLLAEGQVTDANSRDASVASSEAWGLERVDARVGREEGGYGEIYARNTIAFAWDWDISGRSIAEGRVKLQALARDILGREHVFSLNAVVAEQTGFEQTEIRQRGTSSSTRGQIRAGGGGLEAELGGEGGSSESEAQVTRISRTNGQSDGNVGQTEPLVITDEVSGPTTLTASYEVSSTGSVTLAARTSTNGDTVTVTLRKFHVRNELRVWARALPPTDPPPPAPPPPSDPPSPGPDGPTTGGDGGDATTSGGENDPDGGAAGDDLDDGGTSSGGSSLPEPGPQDRRPGARRTTTVPGDDGTPVPLTLAVLEPWGLQGDLGALPGRVRLALDSRVARELRYTVTSEPAGRLDFGGRTELALRPGTTMATLNFHAAEPGAVQIVLTPALPDMAGDPVVLPLDVSADDVALATRPAVWCGFGAGARAPGSGAFVEVVRGDPLPDLRVGRFAFRDLATAPTEFTVEARDPFGLLAFPPETIVVPAGETDVSVPLHANDVEGSAELLLHGAGQTLRVVVRTVPDGWFAVDRIRVPLGAAFPVAFAFDRARGWPRDVGVEVGHTGRLDLLGSAARRVDGRSTVGRFLLRAAGAGTTQVTLRTDGLPDRVVHVDVVAPDVTLGGGVLRVGGLDPTRGGMLRLELPEHARFDSLALPAHAGDVIVEGVDTRAVTLRLEADPGRPETLEFPVVLSGLAPGDRVHVLDGLHNDLGRELVTWYRLPVE